MIRRTTVSMHRQLWILLLCVLLNSGLWMDALHHHEDFSRDNPDCIFCQAAASPASSTCFLAAPQVVHRVVEWTLVQFDLAVIHSSRILRHSPKTGPPVLPA
jgi:hypothetical protein